MTSVVPRRTSLKLTVHDRRPGRCHCNEKRLRAVTVRLKPDTTYKRIFRAVFMTGFTDP